MPVQPVRVLIVDDSAFMRHVISEHLAKDPDIEVVGQARDGEDAVRKAAALRPDVVTLDIEMPRMDGLTALRHIMRESPVPIVMVSAITQAGTDATIRALELGAVDVVGKPTGSISLDFDTVAPELVRKVKRAARTVRVAQLTAIAPPATAGRADAVALRGVGVRPRRDRVDLCVIGASTGGPRALTQVIPLLPAGLAVPVVVVQHMPEHFTASLAKRLDELSALRVSEAGEAAALRPGHVLLARGGRHLEFRSGQQVRLTDTAPVHGVRPSIDVCLQSVPAALRPRTLVAILTGMGSDGADGASAINRAGGYVIAEHESTCVIYGMPRAVVERESASAVVPLDRIAATITRAVEGSGARRSVSVA